MFSELFGNFFKSEDKNADERRVGERRSGIDRRHLAYFDDYTLDDLKRIVEEHKILQHRLHEQAQIKENILDSIPIPFYYKSSSGFYKGCNSSFINLIEKNKDDILTSTAEGLFSYDDAQLVKRADQVLLNSEEKVQVFKANFCNKNIIFSKACFSESDTTYGILGFILDYNENIKEINPPKD